MWVCDLGNDAYGEDVEQVTAPEYAPEVLALMEWLCVAAPPVVPYEEAP